jgi:hypothetical protein
VPACSTKSGLQGKFGCHGGMDRQMFTHYRQQSIVEPGAHKREGAMLEAGLEAIPPSSFFERKMLARQNPMNK